MDKRGRIFIRFDKRSQRSQRLKTDKFAMVSTVWNIFIENSQNCYRPGCNITIDEQLFPTKSPKNSVEIIDRQFLYFGHSYPPNDGDFETIENTIRKRDLLPIAFKKFTDMIDLLPSIYIPAVHHDYFQRLDCNERSSDFILI
uniref:DDE_Tnp_1_7 domain-containing protein n=1 Tax=Glossina austeni TaxID=7395 RepID=A0A1A9VDL9_GLOAU